MTSMFSLALGACLMGCSYLSPEAPTVQVTGAAQAKALHYRSQSEFVLDRASALGVQGTLPLDFDSQLVLGPERVGLLRTSRSDAEVSGFSAASQQAWVVQDGTLTEAWSFGGETERFFTRDPLTFVDQEQVDWQRLSVELGLGILPQDRVVRAGPSESVDGGQLLSGLLRIGAREDVRFLMQVDAEGIVRAAVLEMPQGSVTRTLRVETSGTQQGYAATGHSVLTLVEPSTGRFTLLDEQRLAFQRLEALDAQALEARLDVVPAGALDLDAPPQPQPGIVQVDSGGLVHTDKPPVDDSGGDDSGKVEEKCEDCKLQWVNQVLLFGAMECEHGPEHDNNPLCLAQIAANGGVLDSTLCTENGGFCDCWSCPGYPAADPYGLGCEPEIFYHWAWCDLGDPSLECETTTGEPGLVGMVRAQTPAGGACDGVGGGTMEAALCGSPDGQPKAHGACGATNCASAGGPWVAQRGIQSVCK
ncbi:MAG: hypothetical protein VX899_07200 [Myxococcota bacterium]|nr:hypothetical protein [Myxococcota bacterium]